MTVATAAVKSLPTIATTERMKNQRHNRVYVDVIQNANGLSSPV